MRRVLVMGGAGFLGSNLCKSLLEENFEVFCLDNLSTGSLRNIDQLFSNPKFQLFEQDVRKPFNYKVDLIFNLACPASPPSYQLNPVGTLLTNFQGTLHGLELARDLSIPFLQASTSEVYGDPLEHPQTERYWGNVNPIGPRSCYDEGKRVAETLCADFRKQFRVQTSIFRIFNTYGPGMSRNDGRVVSNFVSQALDNQKITIYGDGSQTRSLCFVDDLISAVKLIAFANQDIAGPINLGNPEEISVLELAKLIIDLSGSSSQIEFHELPIDDPKRRQPDISLAKTVLNWEPRTSLKQGLSATISSFRTSR